MSIESHDFQEDSSSHSEVLLQERATPVKSSDRLTNDEAIQEIKDTLAYEKYLENRESILKELKYYVRNKHYGVAESFIKEYSFALKKDHTLALIASVIQARIAEESTREKEEKKGKAKEEREEYGYKDLVISSPDHELSAGSTAAGTDTAEKDVSFGPEPSEPHSDVDADFDEEAFAREEYKENRIAIFKQLHYYIEKGRYSDAVESLNIFQFAIEEDAELKSFSRVVRRRIEEEKNISEYMKKSSSSDPQKARLEACIAYYDDISHSSSPRDMVRYDICHFILLLDPENEKFQAIELEILKDIDPSDKKNLFAYYEGEFNRCLYNDEKKLKLCKKLLLLDPSNEKYRFIERDIMKYRERMMHSFSLHWTAYLFIALDALGIYAEGIMSWTGFGLIVCAILQIFTLSNLSINPLKNRSVVLRCLLCVAFLFISIVVTK